MIIVEIHPNLESRKEIERVKGRGKAVKSHRFFVKCSVIYGASDFFNVTVTPNKCSFFLSSVSSHECNGVNSCASYSSSKKDHPIVA